MTTLRTTGVFLAAAGLMAAASPTDAIKQNLERQLQARYAPVKLGQGGHAVVSPGVILTVQAPGIRSNPANQFTFMNNYQDGQIKRSAASSLITDRNSVLDLQVGEGVFLYKVEVKDNGVVFHVQPCGNCDFGAVEPFPFRAGITFQMPKDWLLSPDLNQIDQMISRVFSIGGAVPGPPPPAMYAPDPPTPAQAAPPAPTTQAQPLRIELGQSQEQVRSILGEPDKVADLGNKKIFVYKDLKVTFIDGKVTDVQ
jgi:hypothetical protein